jgi:hypothetical protein
MCRSHQNYSNWDLVEDQIASIILRIMELEGVSFDKEGNNNTGNDGGSTRCDVCTKPCGNEWCPTKK